MHRPTDDRSTIGQPSRRTRRSRFPGLLLTAAVATTAIAACSDDGPSIPDALPEHQVDREASGDGPLVAVIGDSIADSARTDLHAALDGRSRLVGAIPGEGFAGGPASMALGANGPAMVRVAEVYADRAPEVAVLALGTNDAWNRDLSLDRALANVDTVAERFDGSCLVTVTLVDAAPAGVAYDTDRAARIDEALARVSDESVPWADLVARHPDLVIADGIHLSARGKQVWAAEVAAAVERCTSP